MTLIDLYRNYIEPYVQASQTPCGILYHDSSVPTIYGEDSKVDKPIYIDPSVIISLLLRRECGEFHKQWLDCLALLSLVDVGFYQAIVSASTFDDIIPTVLIRELKLKRSCEMKKSQLIYLMVETLKNIGGLTIYDENDARSLSVPGLASMGEMEDSIHLGIAIKTNCGILVTYDSDYFVFAQRHNFTRVRIMKPEQLIPAVSDVDQLYDFTYSSQFSLSRP